MWGDGRRGGEGGGFGLARVEHLHHAMNTRGGTTLGERAGRGEGHGVQMCRGEGGTWD